MGATTTVEATACAPVTAPAAAPPRRSLERQPSVLERSLKDLGGALKGTVDAVAVPVTTTVGNVASGAVEVGKAVAVDLPVASWNAVVRAANPQAAMEEGSTSAAAPNAAEDSEPSLP